MSETSPTTPERSAAAEPDFGVYVHVPYCRRKCRYCDFYSLAQEPDPRFGAAIAAELAHCERTPAPDSAVRTGRAVVSIYLGGGTPSLLAPDTVGEIVGAVGHRFDVGSSAEVTVEVNPATADRAALLALRGAGANRLSIGVQSLDDRWLAVLGRLHDAAQAIRSVQAAIAAGFDDVGVDLMLAVPGQTLADSARDVKAIAALGVPHVSAYLLTVEPGTPLHADVQAGRAVAVDDDLAADMLEQAVELLAAAGLARYEISNYARPGTAARHNRLYWSGGEVLGLGPGAHSHFRLADGGGLRFANARDVACYLRCFAAAPPRGDRFPRDEDLLSPAGYLCERLYLGLRDLERGVDLDAAAAAAGIEVWPALERCLAELGDRGLLQRFGTQLRLSADGARLADGVAARILATRAPG
ncbi:MAG: radical SAM family heme chaperone HemW [Deltaproteobacteria bacterium]|nr:radical SAM family heme chaperone HemW [Deltaproteobacteria bacterium]